MQHYSNFSGLKPHTFTTPSSCKPGARLGRAGSPAKGHLTIRAVARAAGSPTAALERVPFHTQAVGRIQCLLTAETWKSFPCWVQAIGWKLLSASRTTFIQFLVTQNFPAWPPNFSQPAMERDPSKMGTLVLHAQNHIHPSPLLYSICGKQVEVLSSHKGKGWHQEVGTAEASQGRRCVVRRSDWDAWHVFRSYLLGQLQNKRGIFLELFGSTAVYCTWPRQQLVSEEGLLLSAVLWKSRHP